MRYKKYEKRNQSDVHLAKKFCFTFCIKSYKFPISVSIFYS